MVQKRRRRLVPNERAVGYQGKEFTCIVQAPTMEDIEFMIHDLEDYADEHGLEQFEVLQKGPDPDGGYKAVIVAHNWNPLTWLAEAGYRAYLGAKGAARVGKAKAVAKHAVGVEAELARAPEEERRRLELEEEKRLRQHIARLEKLKAQTASAKRRQELSAEIQRARLEAVGREKVKTAEELAEEEEKLRRERLLRRFRPPTPTGEAQRAPSDVMGEEDMARYLMGG